MAFLPLPTASVCDLTSKSSVKIAQAVSRTWCNLDPSLWSIIPERITFLADGSGEISSPFTVYSQDGRKPIVMSCKFTWSLIRDCAFSDIDKLTLFETIPKIIRSEGAWIRERWRGGIVPAYIRLNHNGMIAFEPDSPISDPFIPDSPDGMSFCPELLEIIFLMASEEMIAAQALTITCRRSREMVMRRRRKEAFAKLVKRCFITKEIALWIHCGHFDPVSNSSDLPTSFYGMKAQISRHGPPGYTWYDPKARQGHCKLGRGKNRTYYSCKLPIPEEQDPTQ